MIKGKVLILKALNEKGFTYESLSKALNVTPSYLKEIEQGNKDVSKNIHNILSKLCGIEPTSLIESDESQENIMASDDIMQFLNNEESPLEKDHLVDEDCEN